MERYNGMEELTRWNVIAAVPLDINGDERNDLIVILERGGPTLVNRGFGTFFLNPLPRSGGRRRVATIKFRGRSLLELVLPQAISTETSSTICSS